MSPFVLIFRLSRSIVAKRHETSIAILRLTKIIVWTLPFVYTCSPYLSCAYLRVKTVLALNYSPTKLSFFISFPLEKISCVPCYFLTGKWINLKNELFSRVALNYRGYRNRFNQTLFLHSSTYISSFFPCSCLIFTRWLFYNV